MIENVNEFLKAERKRIYAIPQEQYEESKIIVQIDYDEEEEMKKTYNRLLKLGLGMSREARDIAWKLRDNRLTEESNARKVLFKKAFEHFKEKYPMHLLYQEYYRFQIVRDHEYLSMTYSYRYIGNRITKKSVEHIVKNAIYGYDITSENKDDLETTLSFARGNRSYVIALRSELDDSLCKGSKRFEDYIFEPMILRRVEFEKRSHILLISKTD